VKRKKKWEWKHKKATLSLYVLYLISHHKLIYRSEHIRLKALLTSELAGDELPTSCSSHFTTIIYWIGACVNVVLKRKIPSCAGNQMEVIQPLTYSTDWNIRNVRKRVCFSRILVTVLRTTIVFPRAWWRCQCMLSQYPTSALFWYRAVNMSIF
jgi:hypothetical protein